MSDREDISETRAAVLALLGADDSDLSDELVALVRRMARLDDAELAIVASAIIGLHLSRQMPALEERMDALEEWVGMRRALGHDSQAAADLGRQQ